ncbi:3',5'-cyclic-nucleotide phosphodiesterase [Glaciecola petra]|uniref:3',5'-cyclic-nucleotide phosphodiesterase n=1 Tax=Glaciecola petra TaxID=3075602 RepID=A0ABU2ZU49_9ALTE|nr:3',5'-cyclic-nucleotide phosphodiesterase [Aestuariibacter sp. P117]MDT0596161.1 3',5'-cyclic-nucleotide phosphodiesterase [Aestuariibacter sp. P117]
MPITNIFRKNISIFQCAVFIFILKSLIASSTAYAIIKNNAMPTDSLDILVLGTEGGVSSDNLSAFLIGPNDQSYSVACDAGSLLTGIESAVSQRNFSNISVPQDYPLSKAGYVLREHIKGYLISHAHLDHIAGLIIASPEDTKKPIYGSENTIGLIRDHYFNWQAWPNFGDQGNKPHLNKYDFQTLQNKQWQSIPNTSFKVAALPLSHSGVESNAFVIEYKQDLIVCLGDTGPDSVEKSNNIKALWQFIAPSVNKGRLKAIIIESSFTNDTPDDKLFGHLTPKYVNQSLADLAKEIKTPSLLTNLPVIISHVKPSLKKGANIELQMRSELASSNTLKVNFILPKQGQRIHLYALTNNN